MREQDKRGHGGVTEHTHLTSSLPFSTFFECRYLSFFAPVCCSLGLLWFLDFSSLLHWILDSWIWCSLLPLFFSLFTFFGSFLRKGTQGVHTFCNLACLNISLLYFYSWLKIGLGIEFPKIRIIFISILKPFFDITVKKLWWEQYHVLTKSFFVLFGPQNNLAPQCYLELGHGPKTELWPMVVDKSGAPASGSHSPAGSLFPLQGVL